MIRILVFILFFSVVSQVKAQSKTTKETRVVVVITKEEISTLVHYERFRSSRELFLKKYDKSKFFIGVLKGKYRVENDQILPLPEATITIYTEKQIFNKAGLFSKEKPKPGDLLKVGKIKAKVITAGKEEITVKANK